MKLGLRLSLDRTIRGLAIGRPLKRGDANWANVSALLHFNGTQGSSTFTDSTGKVWTPAAAVEINTSQKMFGTASGYFLGGYISTASHVGFGFGAGNYTIEGFYRDQGVAGFQTFFETRTGVNSGICIGHGGEGGGGLFVANDVGVIGTSGTEFTTGAWEHWAVSKLGTTIRAYQNGVEVFNIVDSRTLAAASTAFIGANYLGNQAVSGFLDEVRITKGVARYTANFAPPTTPFQDS